MVKLELPRGMKDLDADEFAAVSHIRDAFFETAQLFNFKLVEPSPLELLATLEAKGGAAISDEVYSFEDKGGRDVALRFDLTIGLTRFVAARRDLKLPVKLATFAGVWRYDEPQANRYRYFHQWDIEIYGPFSQESDAEVIEFVSSFFRRLGLKVSIGISDRRLIEQYVRTKLGISDGDLLLNVFRAIDKVPKKGAEAVLQEYRDRIDPKKLRSLIDLSRVKGSPEKVASATNIAETEGWQELVTLMDSLVARNVRDVNINLGIVRGLDYYSGIVFEAFDSGSDSDALVGGGRYDRLTKAFGRKDIGATGVAGGVERIVAALRRQGILKTSFRPVVYVAYESDELKRKALDIASVLREKGIIADYDMLGRALRRQLEDASNRGVALVAIVTPSEAAAGQVIIRSMKDGTQKSHPIAKLPEIVAEIFTTLSSQHSSS